MIRRGVKCSGSWMLHNVPAEDRNRYDVARL